jgi:hypothetical protein
MKQRREWNNPLNAQGSAVEADAAMYGAVELPGATRVVAKLIEIAQVRPDLRQPRRAIPSIVRGGWDGAADELPAILANWHALVQAKMEREIALERVLNSTGEALEVEFGDPVVDDYLDLLKLSASIHRDGLINPIRVGKHSRGYVIESGERRWLAYNLLATYVSSDYARIPAIERAKVDVWAQAAENGARKPLTAIGMARQLAILIMDMYDGDRGVKFDSYEALVLTGECDRVYYAQVKDGSLYPIKRGMSQRISDATGLSASAIRQYRALLSIPDTLWQKADDQGWSEFAIREYLSLSKQSISEPRSVTHVTPHGKNDSPKGSYGDESPYDSTDNRGAEKALPKTSIGERMGLYDAPAQDDDVYEDDARGEMESQASASSLSRAPLIEQQNDKEMLVALLKMLERYGQAKGDTVLSLRIRELMTMSEYDIGQFTSMNSQSGFFDQYLSVTEKVIVRAWQELLSLISVYVQKLSSTGKRLEEE